MSRASVIRASTAHSIATLDHPIGIGTELLDARNRALAIRAREDDLVASEELVSCVMVQLSENLNLAPVLEELLTAEGSELYLRPASDYMQPDTPTPFGTIVEEGLRRDEAVIGVLDRDSSRPGSSEPQQYSSGGCSGQDADKPAPVPGVHEPRRVAAPHDFVDDVVGGIYERRNQRQTIQLSGSSVETNHERC